MAILILFLCALPTFAQNSNSDIISDAVSSANQTSDLTPPPLTDQVYTTGSPVQPISPIVIQPTIQAAASSTTALPVNTDALLTCMGKVKLACLVNLYVRRLLDKYVGTGRLDKIRDVIEAETINESDRSTLTKAFNDIMKTFTSSSAPNATLKAVAALSPSDMAQIRVPQYRRQQPFWSRYGPSQRL
ncbi:hypothetical protein GCK32_011549 [Trichostrongylus colubriformis]|uniref:Uncharacterized protein n=1 Tax=Trichostrongylus colubriformis TaxID=6319 RepID=A0AAN8G345_TRICO